MTLETWLAPGPVHTLRAGVLMMDVAPAACLHDGFNGLAWPKAGCYPLLPFSNRIRDGRFLWGGREIRLAPHPGQATRHAWRGACASLAT